MKREMRNLMLIAVLFSTVGVFAKENVDTEERRTTRDGQLNTKMKFGSDCDPASQSADLDINNVRTKILNGGDMWWDLNNAKYEIPKLPSETNEVRKHSLFSGAIWIGGEDASGNLKLAAMTYRQRGSDFWPGPLDAATANTSKDQCDIWDEIYKVDGATIIDHANDFNGTVDPEIQNWPGEYAPYRDLNGNGIYDPQGGDYPVLQNKCKGIVQENAAEDQPDQMLWWIYNDRGNIHSETQGEAIGIEMQTTAFAFSTNDEINDMTFYTTRLINRGATNLDNTYFGQWVDADLGNFSDDYVGCDVGLSLGFCYNGDDNDEGVLGYGLNPPSIGVDFFEGPIVTVNGVTEELGMSRFVYYNNTANSINGNPLLATDFYNYLRGKWRTGTDIQFGGDGITGTDGTPAEYMFPFDTDPDHPNQNWNEKEAGNSPADRRFIQSSGPFTLEPGAVQRLTVGVVWARTDFGGADGSLRLLKQASRKAQDLFNSCFDLIDGPDAPEVEVHEQDRQLVFSFGSTDNDRVELYKDSVFNDRGMVENYEFQGYRVYQLKNASVSLSDLDDLGKAREVFQCDLDDDFQDLFEEEYDVDVDEDVLKLRVRSNNGGLRHTVRITEDEFATGSDKTLVNFKTYNYIVLSYASADAARDLYLEGRKVKKFSAIPHKLEPRFSGSSVPSVYGDGPELIRLAGKGNGDNELEFTQSTIDEIMANNIAPNPKYENGMGPVNISVIDPLKVPLGEFELSLVPKTVGSEGGNDDSLAAGGTSWILVKLPSDTIYADTTLDYRNEQVILESTTGQKIFDWGLAVTIEQVADPGVNSQEFDENGLINWTVDFSDPSNEWLTAVSDNDASESRQFGVFDWIRSGVQGQPSFNDPSWHDFSSGGRALDRNGVYEKIWDGRIAPNRLTSNTLRSNASERDAELVQPFTFGYQAMQGVGLENISSVDIVLTPDESKWSQCVMIETGEDPGLNEGKAEKFDMRKGTLTYGDVTLKAGKTIFPGYAINVNTGERLNIIVGEDSYQRSENGRDMKWNPTDNTSFPNSGYPSFGGRHFIYVMGSHQGIAAGIHPKLPAYDEGEAYHAIFSNVTSTNRLRELSKVYQNCDWVIPAYMALGKSLEENADGIPVPPNEMKIRLRIGKPYGRNGVAENSGLPKFKFSTDDIFNDVTLENGKEALDLANIVPNPYYAYSGYEGSPIDNRVKFTNLPEKVQISIYTLDGSLVRRIDKDDETTFVDWNLQNNAGVPVASGLYLIHIDADDLGEKVLKWMGVMRELDLDSF
jgi:hypothetical protein